MSTRTRSGTPDVPSTAVSFGRTRSFTRAFAGAALAGAVALAFVVWPLAVAAAAVSAFAVYAVSSAVRGARQAYGPGGADSRARLSARDRRRMRPDVTGDSGRVR